MNENEKTPNHPSQNINSYPRAVRRKVSRLYNFLGELLGVFYGSLANTQLSEQEVGDLFTKLNHKWINKVKSTGLKLKNGDGVEVKEWLAKEILTTWRKRKKISEEKESQTQQP